MAVLEEAYNMPIILAFGRAKQGDPEFPDSLVYRVSFRLAWAVKAEILFKEKKNQSQSTNQLTEDQERLGVWVMGTGIAAQARWCAFPSQHSNKQQRKPYFCASPVLTLV